MKSEINMAKKGIIKAKYFFPKYNPPKIEIAPMAVKLGGCGIILEKAPIKMISTINSVLFFMYQIYKNKHIYFYSMLYICFYSSFKI